MHLNKQDIVMYAPFFYSLYLYSVKLEAEYTNWGTNIEHNSQVLNINIDITVLSSAA